MTEVAETLANIEQAIRRAERARRAVAVLGREPNVEIALGAGCHPAPGRPQGAVPGGLLSDQQQRLI